MFQYLRAALDYNLRHSVQHLILYVTSFCNLRCKHCFVEFDKQDLTLDQFKLIRDQLGPIQILNIGGGEPIFRKDLVEILRLYSDSGFIGMPTNGWDLKRTLRFLDELFTFFSPQRFGLMISIDGLEGRHDDIRGKGSFRRAVGTLETVRKTYPEMILQVNTVLTAQNYQEIPELIDFVYSNYRPSYHSVLLLRGTPLDQSVTLPPIPEIRKFLSIYEKSISRYDYNRSGITQVVARNYHRYLWDLSIRTLEEKTQVVPCLGGQAHLVIYSDGRVAPCELLPTVGNIKETPLKEILSSTSFVQAVQGIKDRHCHCTHNCNMTDNILFNPRNYPRLIGLPFGGY
ncbi:MAG: radical SAM/SPASM domain-containing protein [Acidobacteriota bacterium]